MAPHSSTQIPRTGEPGGPPSVGSHTQTRLKRLGGGSSGRGKQSRLNIELLKKGNMWIEDKSSSPDFLFIKDVI